MTSVRAGNPKSVNKTIMITTSPLHLRSKIPLMGKGEFEKFLHGGGWLFVPPGVIRARDRNTARQRTGR